MQTAIQIVTMKGARHFPPAFDEITVIREIESMGFRFQKREDRQCLRAELKGLPKYEGLAGPMYNGIDHNGDVCVRYETYDAYEFYSR